MADVQNVTPIQGILWKGAAKTHFSPLAQSCRVSVLEYSLQGKPGRVQQVGEE